MSQSEYLEVRLGQLSKYFPAITSKDVSDDFFISGFSNGSELGILEHPFRFDGYFAYFCVKGNFEVEVNMRKFDIAEGTLLFYVPGNIINLCKSRNAKGSQFVVLAMSRRFLQNSKINYSNIFEETLVMMKNPCIHLRPDELKTCGMYYRLSEKLIKSDLSNLVPIMMDLCASLFNYLGSLWSDRMVERSGDAQKTVRSKSIFEKFMHLVSEYHSSEREVGFYAAKLNITPKYLSQLVKRVSGQSAPDWIADFVIMEAKNYLKYSDMDIKVIAYKLNFSSTPSFFRYFKAHAGMTPLGFRRS